MNTKYYDNGDKTTIIEYRFVGYGLDSQSVYQKIITTYSIAEGVIIDHEPQPIKTWYR
jgi:hypothetical protein